MSVRICYVERSERGGMLRALRLVGVAQDEQWNDQGLGSVEAGAAWVKQRLAGTRSAGSLTLLCLDVEGGVCSWISSPSASPTVVAAVARQGGSGLAEAGGRPGTTAVEYYAGDGFSSSIQALEVYRNGTSKRGAAMAESRRLAVLAMTDVPARLLMDALDHEGIPVESAASLWHVMAAAWDPSAPRPGTSTDPLTGETAALTAIIMVDAASSRLVWAWSRAGKLVVAGSMRLRQAAPETAALAQPGEAAPLEIVYGPEEVSRLAAEWLTWSAQIAQAPGRFVCVLPDREQAGAFGRALGEAWPGSAVDVVTGEDPVGATLKRAANLLENTPEKADEPDPQAGLVDLSRRPGKQHRRMYIWWAGAVGAAAAVMVVVGVQLRGAAGKASAAAAEWKEQGAAVISKVMPDAKDTPGRSRYKVFTDAVAAAEHRTEPPKRTEPAMPVLEELETISLVVGNNGYAVESIDLDSKGLPRFTAVANTTLEAESLLGALKRISGSHVVDWTASYSNKREGDQDKVRVMFSGRWAPDKGGAR